MPNGIGGISGNSGTPPTPPSNAGSASATSSQMGPTSGGRTVTHATGSSSINPNQHTTEPTTGPQRLVTPRTTGAGRFILRMITAGAAAAVAMRASEPTVNPRSTNHSDDSSVTSTHRNNGVTTTHPVDWTTRQQSSLQHAMDRAGGVDSTSTTAATTQDYTQQGARPRTTQNRNPQTQARHTQRNTRWARNQERQRRNADEPRNRRETRTPPPAEPENHQADDSMTSSGVTCGTAASLSLQRVKVAKGTANSTDLSSLGAFHDCKAMNYDHAASALGDATASWRYAQRLLGQSGPRMIPSNAALQAVANARLLGNQDATQWADQFIEDHMRHAQAYMSNGSFDPAQPINEAGQYTEDSLSFLASAAWAGFGYAQFAAARVAFSHHQVHLAWQMLQLGFSNESYLASSLSPADIALVQWAIEMISTLASSYLQAGITEDQMRAIADAMSAFQAAYSNT